jgi:hypothetical protein
VEEAAVVVEDLEAVVEPVVTEHLFQEEQKYH